MRTDRMPPKDLLPREFLLSHHPNCPPYSEHTVKIGSKKFCIGCFIGYPSGIIGIIVGAIFLNIDLEYSKQILFSSMLLLSFFMLSFTQFTRYKKVKIIQKMLIGLGGGLFLTYIYFYPESRGLTLLTTFTTAIALIGIMNVFHYRSDKKICQKCYYLPDKPDCPGFKEKKNSQEEEGK